MLRKCPTDSELIVRIKFGSNAQNAIARKCLFLRYKKTVDDIVADWIIDPRLARKVKGWTWRVHICPHITNIQFELKETIEWWIASVATRAVYEYLDSPQGDLALLNAIQQCVQPDTSNRAFQYLYEKYTPFLNRQVNSNWYGLSKDDADDAVMDVWEYVVQHIPSYKWQGIPIRHWLSTIARRKAQERRRKPKDQEYDDHLKAYSMAALDRLKEELDVQDDTTPIVDSEIQNAINQLTPAQAKIIRLAFFNEFNATQIGLVMDWKSDRVRQQKSRALKKLRKLLGHLYN